MCCWDYPAAHSGQHWLPTVELFRFCFQANYIPVSVIEVYLLFIIIIHRLFALKQIFAICAFATCGGYYGRVQVKVDCADRRDSNRSINIDFSYPFR